MTRFKKSGGQVLITLADYEEAVSNRWSNS